MKSDKLDLTNITVFKKCMYNHIEQTQKLFCKQCGQPLHELIPKKK